ncbi:hypothetical protein [Mastigocladopsis repens]|nr:hypothetical protein [Mastigocladopsis repens]
MKRLKCDCSEHCAASGVRPHLPKVRSSLMLFILFGAIAQKAITFTK